MFAAINGHTETVSALLSQDGIDVNAKTSDRFFSLTALMFAAENGHAETVDKLLAQGADVNAKTSNGFLGLTARGIAVAKHHHEIASKLSEFRSGANAKAKTSNDSTALIMAAQNGHTEIVAALLLRQDINVNATLDGGETALMLAAVNGHTEIVSALLSKDGIDVDAKTDEKTFGGSTALTIAARSGQAEAVSILLSRKDVDWKKVENQLSDPALRSDNEALLLLAATIHNEKLRNSIIASFNEKNPDNKIKQIDNSKAAKGGISTPRVSDLAAELQKGQIKSPASSIETRITEPAKTIVNPKNPSFSI
jgi:serine/threonine-protein phosphatase 6 regulatory ankyrin repeat subunit B